MAAPETPSPAVLGNPEANLDTKLGEARDRFLKAVSITLEGKPWKFKADAVHKRINVTKETKLTGHQYMNVVVQGKQESGTGTVVVKDYAVLVDDEQHQRMDIVVDNQTGNIRIKLLNKPREAEIGTDELDRKNPHVIDMIVIKLNECANVLERHMLTAETRGQLLNAVRDFNIGGTAEDAATEKA